MPLKPSTLALCAGALLTGLSAGATAQSPMEILQGDAPTNWGKWGEDDQVGALNYLGEAEAKNGAGAITSGKTFTLQIPMTSGSGPVFPGRVPTQHFMATDAGVYMAGKAEPAPGGIKYSDDVAFMYLQGTTHVDGLAHAWYGDKVYGGKSEATSVHGHTHADVGEIGKKGIVGRAVLLDVGRHMGSDDLHRLPTETCIHLKDLEATAEAQGTTINKRDILVIRTGSIARFWEEEPDEQWNAMNEPGLCYSKELLSWLDRMETPMIATDNIAVEKVVQQIDGETYIIPLHGALMRDMGVVLSEIWWLDDLAADSAEDGQYSFMLVAAPLKVEQGTGSPVNPVAIK
ncbi:Kynurenine formamidase [Marinobacter daqiaonensis]|uniref:Kynurenine formamidase n=1 Tax=Marinobacter daqiaonensis TaxID=650891 RepID=A0A1I6IBY8_9GAMM|nr:cyclase family protein [Marinobacter daqiaonensis]SFR64218.1 Kynurenine formamidase [Marinobacter daqiaonensis]